MKSQKSVRGMPCFSSRTKLRKKRLKQPLGDPLTYLVYDEAFAELRAMVENGGFEKLLHDLLVKEDDLVVLHTLPSTTLGEELRAEEAAKLEAISAKWTAEEKAAILDMNEKLHAWQQTGDTPEQLATLPVLDLSEVSLDPLLLHTEESTVDNVTELQFNLLLIKLMKYLCD